MKKINQLQFKHKFNVEILPTETLLGVELLIVNYYVKMMNTAQL